MKIEEIDKNLKVETDIQRDDLVWLNIREAPFAIYELYHPTEPGPFHRMDPAVAKKVSAGGGEPEPTYRRRTDSFCYRFSVYCDSNGSTCRGNYAAYHKTRSVGI